MTTTEDRFVALDSLRGVAALGVVARHFAGVGLTPVWPIAASGYLFVDFFFVISGFVIAASYGERLAQGFSRTRFTVLRLGRVYPMHLAMVLVGVVAAFATRVPVFAGNHDGWHLLRALFLLDGYATGQGNFFVGQSWSISVELLLYAIAAVLAGKGRRGMILAAALALSAAVSLLAGFEVAVWSSNVQRGLFGFALGAVTFAAYRRRVGAGWPHATTSAAALILALLFVASAQWLGTFAWLAALPFALVVLAFAPDRGWPARMLAAAPTRALGRWSYSIYLTHFYVIGAAGHLALKLRGEQRASDEPIFRQLLMTPAEQAVWAAAVLAAVLAVSVVAYRLIEEPGRAWSRRVAQKFGKGAHESS